MYPKVFAEYAEHYRTYGDVSVLPTPVFFYGLNEKDEMAVEIDKGKTLVVRLTGRTEANDDGEVKLFFELNGQPRPMRIAKAGGVETFACLDRKPRKVTRVESNARELSSAIAHLFADGDPRGGALVAYLASLGGGLLDKVKGMFG
jgi:pyruvate carboxylase